MLIRGATGNLYFLRDDHERPQLIRNAELKRRFEAYAKGHPSRGDVVKDIEQDVLDLLEDLFGPLIGAWWVWGPRLGR